MSRLGRAGLVAGTVALFVGCSTSSTSKPSSTTATSGQAAGATVVLKNIKFKPADIRIQVGDTVTWVWQDSPVTHNVTFSNFSSATQASGVYTHTFASPGTFSYSCTIHTNMTGTVTVS